MAIYELQPERLRPLARTTFSAVTVRERQDLQRLLRDQVEIVAPDTLVLAEEFGDWEGARRRIDILALDRQGNLVVIELKRTDDGGHSELQAIRYAAMIAGMTFAQAVAAHADYLQQRGIPKSAEAHILEFLGWPEPEEESFAGDVRVVLVSAEFSPEVTSTVLWLNERNLDIRCVRLHPYADGDKVLLDVQQVIPLPEAKDYQVRIREKQQRERAERTSARDLTRYSLRIGRETEDDLPKRRLALRVFHGLCRLGHTPDALLAAVADLRSNAVLSVPGEWETKDDFLCAAERAAAARGRSFDPKRWFKADEELIRSNGQTYAVSNGWGQETLDWCNKLISATHADAEIAIFDAAGDA